MAPGDSQRDSLELISANRFAEKSLRSKRSSDSPQIRDSQSFSPPKRDSRESGNSRESANRANPAFLSTLHTTFLIFSLLISEDFWVFLSFPSDRSIFSTFVGRIKTLRSLRKERRTQKSSLISKEKVNKVTCYRRSKFSPLGAEIWEGDERRKFRFLESGNSLNGQNLFNELPFL